MFEDLWSANQLVSAAALALLIVGLNFAIPFGGGSWLRPLIVHCLSCLLVVWLALSPVAQSAVGQVGPEPDVITDGPRPAWIPHGPSEPNNRPLLAPGYRMAGPPPPARAIFSLLIYVVLASIGQAVAWSRRSRARERRVLVTEAQLARAQLSALQMQINPHFLFNALNSISTLIHSDPRAAQDTLSDLGELLRRVLQTENESQVTLRRELEFLDAYLGIEQRRFAQRLRIERVIQSDLLEAHVPTLILQPIVENAIKHGIEAKREGGVVRIEACKSEGFLHIQISDSGPGISHLLSLPNVGGIGLANTRMRLEHCYGNGYVLNVTNNAWGGCTVSVKIPYHTEPVEPSARI